MLKVQECSGAVGMAQPVKKCKRQRGTQLQQLEGYTQCWKPRGSRACPRPAKDKSSSVTRSTASLLRLGHKNASGSGGDLFVGTAKRGVPPVRGRVWGMHLAPFITVTTREQNSTLLRATAGNGHYTQRMQISLHYNLLGLHARIVSYLVSRKRSVTVFLISLLLSRRRKKN